jgi:hypothetical protein
MNDLIQVLRYQGSRDPDGGGATDGGADGCTVFGWRTAIRVAHKWHRFRVSDSPGWQRRPRLKLR